MMIDKMICSIGLILLTLTAVGCQPREDVNSYTGVVKEVRHDGTWRKIIFESGTFLHAKNDGGIIYKGQLATYRWNNRKEITSVELITTQNERDLYEQQLASNRLLQERGLVRPASIENEIPDDK